MEIEPPPPVEFPARRCWAEVDLGAIRRNLATARRAAGNAAAMAVVKADAYGLGLEAVARALDGEVAFFGVACTREALALRTAGVRSPVFLLGPTLPEERAAVVRQRFVPSVSGIEEAEDFNAAAAEQGVRFPIHVVLDTGMGRIGITEDRALETVAAIAALPHVVVDGIASHFPSADEDEAFTRAQAGRFRSLVGRLAAGGISPRWIHLANSAGILGFPDPAQTLVRPGLMLYGVSPLAGHQPGIAPVLTLKARVTLVRMLPSGHGVSYGRTFITRRPTRVATIAAGYGDGFPRHLSNRGADVLVRGRRCPLLGRVTMDQIMVDVTDLDPPVAPGETAVLIGSQGGESIPPTELAEKAGTIAWEVLTRLTGRVLRVYTPPEFR